MPLASWLASNVLLALVLALAAWAARRLGRPAVAHLLWVLVLVKLVTPPLVTVPLGQSPTPAACAAGTCGCDHHAPTQSVGRDVLPWALAAAWSAGAAVTAGLAWRRWAMFRRLLAHAGPAPPEWAALADRLAAELALRRPPEVLAVPGRLPPFVLPGWRRPRLFLPADLLDQLGEAQRAALLVHELTHIRRGDHLVRVLEFAVGVAYWWLPVVGAVGRQLRACEEACCDAAVVGRLPDGRRDYARLLLDVIDFADAHAAAPATAMAAANDLEQRLRAILDPRLEPRRARVVGALAVCLACTALPCRLQYDFAPRPVPVRAEPPAEDIHPPDDAPWSKAMCCPS